jgi:hypothetical protein
LIDTFESGGGDTSAYIFQTVFEIFKDQSARTDPKKRTVLMGPLSSAQTRLINGLATVNTAPIVSFSATVPSLSSKFDYPWFFRVCYSDSERVKVFADVMQKFGWRKAVILSTSDFYGTATSNALASLLPPGALTVYSYDTPEGTTRAAHLESIASQIIDSELKVIFFLAAPGFNETVRCLTMSEGCNVRQNLTFASGGYVWIFGDAFPFYDPNPSTQLCDALSGSLVVESSQASKWKDAQKNTTPPSYFSNTTKTLLDYRAEALTDFQLDHQTPVFFPDHFWRQEYMPFIVDAFYAVAHAYRILRENSIRPDGCALKAALQKNVSFDGYTGFVQFDAQQDRTVSSFELTTAVNGQCSDVTSDRVSVGRWTSGQGLETSGMPPVWNGQIPSDGVKIGIKPPHISPQSGVGVAIAAMLLINIPSIVCLTYFRTTRIITSAPFIHLFLLVLGLNLLLLTLIPMTASPTNASCVLQILLAVVGYATIISAIGSKAFIYELLARRGKQEKVGLSQLSNRRVSLIIFIGVLPILLVTAIVLGADTPKATTTIEGELYVTRCTTKNGAGLYVLLTLCILTSIVAATLAFRNRNSLVSSDAKFLLFAIGNTSLLGIVGVVIGFILRKKDFGAVLIVFLIAITFGAVATWGLVFGPRIFRLYTNYKKGRLWQRRSEKIPPLRHMLGDDVRRTTVHEQDQDVELDEASGESDSDQDENAGNREAAPSSEVDPGDSLHAPLLLEKSSPDASPSVTLDPPYDD